MSYRDKTYCASQNCKNECGRKMSDYERKESQREEIPVMWGYFCGEPEKRWPLHAYSKEEFIKMYPPKEGKE